MRSIGVENNLSGKLFDRTTTKLAAAFKVDTDKQRKDSVHIKSNNASFPLAAATTATPIPLAILRQLLRLYLF